MIELAILTVATVGVYEGFQHVFGKKRDAALDFAVRSSKDLAGANIHRHRRRTKRA